MKETKVYVDDLPENCKKCVYSQINLAFGVETRICNLQYGFISANNDKFPNCPLQSLKTHDRELVKEVLEKVKNEAYKEGFVDEYGDRVVSYHIYNFLLDKIQKEFEK